MKILVFGANGYLASNIIKYFSKIETIADTTTDISNFNQVLQSVERHKPDWVANCAAKTDEDLCEQNVEYWQEMIRANLLGAINILKICYLKNIKLCHIRTPFELQPIDDYSLSKISAYEFISAKKYKNIVLSLTPSWMFGGVNSRQFDSLLVRSAKEKFPLGLTNNSISTPVYMPDLVNEIEKYILADKRGNFQLGGTESCTRYEFAQCLAQNLNKTMEELNWTENNNFPEKAKRPKDWRCVGYLPSYKERMKDFIKDNDL